ncbi:RmlC-like cupin domain-containing protein [Crepidotus variabilis]|uniref:Mannose-6-phosphate isomerase n=1 Tax=Crepidotus variabilis TaxID=179855 RepID=A0A9P6E8D8_9AGAR|nr:RmlC-like cupin domain-containing protein [Crepidotus variabilis]
MATSLSVFKLIPTSQKYDWGKIGRTSSVALLSEASKVPDFSIDEKSPYAELWMGTHPSGLSCLTSSGESLSSHLAKHPEFMGKGILENFKNEGSEQGNLPFLFKILSIEKCLSIQAHPSKEQAKTLHAQRPDKYPDPNHKPEMALAITPFQALCGFRPIPEIIANINRTPELKEFIPASLFDKLSIPSDDKKRALREVFAAAIDPPADQVKAQLDKLLARYKAQEYAKDEDLEIVDLVQRLATQFPGDVGVFAPFLLNYMKLQPGEAIFLGAGEPHAYIYGECIECMANSDNVIRAGLTPKYRDVANLITHLTYVDAPPSKHVVRSTPFDSAAKASSLYNPPIPEFSVIRTVLSSNQKRETHRPIDGPSLAIVVDGQGTISWGKEKLELGKGDVVFIGAGAGVDFECEQEITVYRAFAEPV